MIHLVISHLSNTAVILTICLSILYNKRTALIECSVFYSLRFLEGDQKKMR